MTQQDRPLGRMAFQELGQVPHVIEHFVTFARRAMEGLAMPREIQGNHPVIQGQAGTQSAETGRIIQPAMESDDRGLSVRPQHNPPSTPAGVSNWQ